MYVVAPSSHMAALDEEEGTDWGKDLGAEREGDGA